ncbi:MAG: hypothetical protein ACI9QL_002605 [Candidatus Omnitrophota bacterium]
MFSGVDTTGGIEIRISDTVNSPLATLNWNPGSGASDFVDRIRIADEQTGPARGVMVHQSGAIRLDQDWFHIGRRGEGTYAASGSASVSADDRISIAEGANNHVTVGVANLSGNSKITTSSGNESFIAVGVNADGFLNMTDNSVAESRHWRVGNNTGAQGTINLSNNAVFRTGHTGDGQLSLGRSGEGNIVMGDNSKVELVNNTSLRVGDNNNGVGNVVMSGTSRILGTGNGNGHVVVGDDGTSIGSITMNNSSGITDARVLWLGNGGSSAGSLTMNDDSYVNLNRNDRSFRMSQGGTADGTLIMNQKATLTTTSFGIDQGGGTSGGTATIVQNNDSRINTTSWTEVGGGNADTTTWTLNDNSQVIATATTRIGMRGNGTGVLTLNNNAYYQANAAGGEFGVAFGDTAVGIVNINDNAFLDVRNNFLVAANGEGTQAMGTVNQAGGSVQVGNTLYLGLDGAVGNAGTYNLNGGTLRTDRIEIRAGGNFEWGAGTLTMEEPNQGANGNGIEIEIVGANNNLATSAGSVLDLGDVYKSNGINFDKLDLNGGALDLTAVGDTLEIWRYVTAFRPGGSNTSATYEIKLINSPSITGEFDNVTGPGPDFQYFGVYSSAQVATLGLTPTNLPRNRGFIDYRADGAYFVFNVAGQVPEPSTGLFLLFGTMMLRSVSMMRRNQRERRRYRA